MLKQPVEEWEYAGCILQNLAGYAQLFKLFKRPFPNLTPFLDFAIIWHGLKTW